MRTLIKFSFVLMLFALATTSCKNKNKAAKTGDAVATKTATAAAKSFTVDQGTVHWTGSKVAGEHKGTINIKSGLVSAEGNKLVSGNFIIDMASLTNTDMTGKKKTDLEGHLKNQDFFDVEKFPTAAFAIASATAKDGENSNYEITGNLTMKGKTKSITFPALVMVKDGKLTAHSDKFTIDRTDWDVMYGSGSLADAVKDKIISDDVVMEITFTGK